MRYGGTKVIRRRAFLINKDLQYSLMITAVLYVVLFLAILGAALFIPLFVELGKAGGSFGEVQMAAAGIVLYLHENFWPAALFSIVLIGLLSMRTSHRIAGPLYQITLLLESLKNGKLPKSVHIRKGDRLAAEVAVANQMLDSLRNQVREIQGAQADLYDAIVACEKTIGHASTETDEIIERMKVVRETADRLTNRIGYFKVE